MAYGIVIGNKRYSSWSLRGWLAVKLAAAASGEAVEETMVWLDRPETRGQLLAQSPAGRVPVLKHRGLTIWDSLAIAEYLAEVKPEAGLLPTDRTARAHCRAVSGEIHSGFYNLRSALPMNLKAQHKAFKIFSGARPDVERIRTIWTECLETYGGPYLFGEKLSIADAMYAPVCTRFRTYAVELDPLLQAYCDKIFDWPLMQEWTASALEEPDEIIELEVEF